MAFDLPTLWAALIAFAVLAHVILDGFDLGIGILFPALSGRKDRHLAMNTIAPVWDGNETWLVLGGGGLFAVFPLAYAVVMPALYPLIIAMLLGLIFRGVAFEFVHRTRRMQGFWEAGFFAGSLVATLAQGLALGALIQGIAVENRAIAGRFWDWLTPFSGLTALALLAGYATLGAAWLVLKIEGALRDRARSLALPLGAVFVALISAPSLPAAARCAPRTAITDAQLAVVRWALSCRGGRTGAGRAGNQGRHHALIMSGQAPPSPRSTARHRQAAEAAAGPRARPGSAAASRGETSP